MKHVRGTGFLILGTIFLLLMSTGCTPVNSGSTEEYRVVTQIDVVYHNTSQRSEGSFVDPEKMQKILYYLRKISPYGTPTDNPDEVHGSDFYITLHYSDHTIKTYHQRDDRFMRIDGGPWKRIDPKHALMLTQILGSISSDTSKSHVSFLLPGEK